MVTKKIKKLRDELRSESSAPKIARLKKEIANEAGRERAEVAALPRPPTGSYSHKDYDPRVVEQLRKEQELQIAKTPEQVAKEQAQAASITAKPILEEAGAFEEVTPKELSLQADTGKGLLAPSREALLSSSQPNSLVGFLRNKEKIKTGKDVFPILDDTTLRESALTEIRQKSFNEGLSQRESFGSVIEAIPVVGGLIGKYVGGIVEAPYANQKNVLAEINKLKEAASTGQEKVRNGLENPDYGLGRAREMEEDIAKLEGRIKLLINSSAVLRANTDEVNVIQEAILETKEKINRYRTASEFGLTASLTGTGRIIPTDEQMYLELKGRST